MISSIQNISRLRDSLSLHADRILFHCDDGTNLSYSSQNHLNENSAFRDTRRRLVFCMCDNEPGGLSGYLSLLSVDAVPLMLGTNLAPALFQNLVSAYRPAFAWLPEKRVSEFVDGRVLLSHLGYSLVASAEDETYPMDESLALLLSTSGSTGTPKFVRLSHDNMLSNAAAIGRYLDITADERPITTLPPSYSFGLSILHSHILAGSTIALTNRTFFDRGFWDFLKSAGATSFGGVPYHFEMLKKLRFHLMDLPSLKTLTQAGARMEPELTREFAEHCERKGIRYFSMYGQTEATARMSYLLPEKTQAKAGSIGQPIPGGEFWLENEDGEIIEGPGVAGELVYRGRNVSMGYAEGYQDLALGDQRDGVLRTGDVACRDSDGDYYIVGRLKRFLKMFGHRINLQDVEAQLLAAGHTVICAGQDDMLEVYIPQGSGEAGKLIKSKVASDFGINPKAVSVYAIAEVPRSDAGKILYSQLKLLAGNALI
ncbi:acyl-coenzyme A synthetase/AMP-(fatty) acid ligase [Rhizobium sp. BK529]|uniref:AMP-binding protein n=1 Tax=unclassified Rhizobium TaxID=2613769 RepID=UPI00104557B9|nr:MULTISPECIES: AMP-binding protein [unclassified Rhizobium]MBB3592895.1 acyl-coenzyme A synthetase/AMP-(fatty) acid ligase [Rhizobium sp. BK529]TCS07276.1 acyl-CoA synthetase (AMP-forming)/AMP-acid ligase II [Rhizobium sp. BK418]